MSDIMHPTLFLCWSGHRSKQVAEAFKTYFESVFKAADLKPGSGWPPLIAMSETLIAKGAPWSEQLLQDLKNAGAGIVVLTPENRGSAWLHFEGGAIATQGFKAQNGGANTAPSQNNLFGFLFTIDSTQIEGPLSLFQATTYRRDYDRDRAELKLLTIAVLDFFKRHGKYDDDQLVNLLAKLRDELLGNLVDRPSKELLGGHLDKLLGRFRELQFLGFRDLVPGLEGHARQIFQSIQDLPADRDATPLKLLPRCVQALSAMLPLQKLFEDREREIEVTCAPSQQMFFERLVEVLSASTRGLERAIVEASEKGLEPFGEPLGKLRLMLEVAVEPLVPVLDDAWRYAFYALHGPRVEAYSKQKLLLIHPLESTLQRAEVDNAQRAEVDNAPRAERVPEVPPGHLLSQKEKLRALRSFWAYDRVAAYIHYCEDTSRPTRDELTATLSELTQAVLKEISLIELSMSGARQQESTVDGKQEPDDDGKQEPDDDGKQEPDDLPLRFALRALILKIKIGIGHGSDVFGKRETILDQSVVHEVVESRIKGETGLSFEGIKELITSLRAVDNKIGLPSAVGLKRPLLSLCKDLERLVGTRSESP